jgi:acetyl-CoA carboxylase biotin carboxyl carrier protein
MDLKEIQALIKFVAKSGAQEVSLETEDFKINIKTGSDAEQPTIIQAMAPQAPVAMAAAPTPAAPASAAAAPTAAAPADDNSNYITVKSPMIGTFYRSASPDEFFFVNLLL